MALIQSFDKTHLQSEKHHAEKLVKSKNNSPRFDRLKLAVKDYMKGVRYRYALGQVVIALLLISCTAEAGSYSTDTGGEQVTFVATVTPENSGGTSSDIVESVAPAQDVPTLTPNEVQTAIGTGNPNLDKSYIDYIDGSPVPLDQVFTQPIEAATSGSPILYPDLTIVPSPSPETAYRLGEDRLSFYFPTTFANIGPGPLRLQAAGLETSGSGASMKVAQILYAKDELTGQVVAYEAPAGNFEHHPSHGHFHFENFVTVEVFVPATGEVVRVDKASFCLQDGNVAMDPFHPGIVELSQGAAPPNAVYQGCGAHIQGLSPGYVDHYGENVPGQNIRLQYPVPPGAAVIIRYILNPNSALIESDYANNRFEQSVVFP